MGGRRWKEGREGEGGGGEGGEGGEGRALSGCTGGGCPPPALILELGAEQATRGQGPQPSVWLCTGRVPSLGLSFRSSRGLW